jgi:GxxExxY protein
MNSKDLNQIGFSVVGAAIEVHKILGPGLLESIYQKAMEIELKSRKHIVKTQVLVPVVYKDEIIANDLRVDLLVDDAVIIELKAVSEIHPKMQSQLLTYLRLTDLQLGYLINFHEVKLLAGLQRLVNNFDRAA